MFLCCYVASCYPTSSFLLHPPPPHPLQRECEELDWTRGGHTLSGQEGSEGWDPNGPRQMEEGYVLGGDTHHQLSPREVQQLALQRLLPSTEPEQYMEGPEPSSEELERQIVQAEEATAHQSHNLSTTQSHIQTKTQTPPHSMEQSTQQQKQLQTPQQKTPQQQQHAPQQPTPQQSTPQQSTLQQQQLWSCAVCTFENPSNAKLCEVCNTPRGSGFTQQQPLDSTEMTSALGGDTQLTALQVSFVIRCNLL